MIQFLTATAIATVMAASALAQPSPPAPPAAPRADKVMVRSEVQARVRDHFARMDANKDGAITTAEIAQRHGLMGKHGMGHGGHGAMIRHDGAMHDPAAAFDRLDINKDGMISRDEFAKRREIRIEKRIAMHGDGAMPAGTPGAKHKLPIHGMGGGRMIVMADANHDGRITLAEAETMALHHFDRMDSNHDGRVTREERRAGRPMIMKMRQAPKAG